MYIPKRYEEDDPEEIIRLIQTYSFATLISGQPPRPVATHLPLEWDLKEDGQARLLGHVARPNPQARAFDGQQVLLAIFHGPHAYVSSSWYDHPNVPTWNYQAVHVYGVATRLSEAETAASLEKLVSRYEADRPEGVSWQGFPDRVKGMARGVIAFEMSVDRIEAKSKLSQNRQQADYEHIIKLLAEGDEQERAVAEAMKKRHATLFTSDS
ncbi:MAG: FMN-binding negative transcriptional regulator [Bacteroidota bacterium]